MLDDKNVPYFGYSEERSEWKEIFIHPRDAFGVLIQIAEFEPNDYLDASVKLPEGKKWSIKKNKTGAVIDFAHPGGGKVQIELTDAEISALGNDLNHI
jgi:methylmalonyl-CoA/ethylmalonyl-CoA epimerase